MNYSKIYQTALAVHSLIPHLLGNGRAFPPLRVQLDLTYRCNLRCSMCYQEKIFTKEEELTVEEWIKVIDQLPRFCVITLFGGEPLVRRDFKEIANHALSSHRCNLVTNGVLLTPEMNRFLIEKNLFLVGVSIDGVGKIHDQARGAPGAYEKVTNNIKDLQKQKNQRGANLPLLDIKTVVTKTNLENLEELFETVNHLQADFFTISLPKISKASSARRLAFRSNKFPPPETGPEKNHLSPLENQNPPLSQIQLDRKYRSKSL